jgi:carbamoyl-phosphate synthase large subunit
MAARIMGGKTLEELELTEEVVPNYWTVKESVFPFNRFQGQDILLSPEMKSTGEVMGIDKDLGIAFGKSQMAAGSSLPLEGSVFISVNDFDKAEVAELAEKFERLGFDLVSTSGTAAILRERGLTVREIFKVSEGRPNALDLLLNKEIQLVVNSPSGQTPRSDEVKIRTTSVYTGVPIITTLGSAKAAVSAISTLKEQGYSVAALQDFHRLMD